MGGLFGSGAAKRAAREQSESIAKQKQIEGARLAEEESEIAKRRALTESGRGGRSLLIATSPTGVKAKTLGGV